jgi:aspartate ammonia-lyase
MRLSDMMTKRKGFRIEKDSLGEKEVPAGAYYGIQTLRAVENFPVSGLGPHPEFVEATVRIKRAAALTNTALARYTNLDRRKARAIIRACDEVLGGKHRDQFVVDVFQAGAGTSHNMNVNEVLANRANEFLGGKKGEYKPIHPNDHVNLGQSTNDVIPTAIRLAALNLVWGKPKGSSLLSALDGLALRLKEKGREFDAIIKAGRTHLQDAVPVRLGQEFSAWAEIVLEHKERIAQASRESFSLGLGGSAAGTGLNTAPGYRERVARELAKDMGLPLRPAKNSMAAMMSMAPFVSLSGALRNLAQDLGKIANDLRLLSSGPFTGFAEITLPPVQPGSSIMPGKVNPVMAEMTNMVCFEVIGQDLVITQAAQAGQLELNVMMPLIAHALLFSLGIMTHALTLLAERCIKGITADPKRCREYAERSLALATALNPRIGYARAAEYAKKSLTSGKTIRRVLEESGQFTKQEMERLLDLKEMTELPKIKRPRGK